MKRNTILTLTSLLLVPLTALNAADTAPQVIWASEPVRPDETLMVMGEGFTGNSVVELGLRTDSSNPGAKEWTELRPIQASKRSLKVVVPKEWPLNMWVW